MVNSKPSIGCILLIRDTDGKYAFLLRQNTSWMNGYYNWPGGKIEKGETFTGAALRELKEEVGITAKSKDLKLKYLLHINDQDEWLHIIFEVTDYEGTPRNAEPHVHGELVWFDESELPENVVPTVWPVLKGLKEGKDYGEFKYE